MKLFLKKGEYKWSPEGTHICDERGFAVVCEEDCEVEIPNQEKFSHAQKVVSEDRAIRGVFVSAPVFSAPQAEPEQVEAPAEVIEQPAEVEAPAEPEPTSASSSTQPAPEEPPAQPAPEESPQVHAEPEPQAHGQETSEVPETQPVAEQSAESPTVPE